MAHKNGNGNGNELKVQYTEDLKGSAAGRVWVEWKTADNKHDAFKAWNSVRFAGHEDVLAVRILSGSEIIAFDGRGERGFILDSWK